MEVARARSAGRMSQLLEHAKVRLLPLVNLSDGLLVIGGALYLLGYFVWSLNAWWNNLSLLPALSSQYIMAGGILGFFLLLLYFGIAGLWLLRKRLGFWLNPLVRWKRLARWTIFVASLCAWLVFFIAPFFGERVSQIGAVVWVATSLLVVPLPGLREALERLKARVKTIENRHFRDFFESLLDSLSAYLFSVGRLIEHYFSVVAIMAFCVFGFDLAIDTYLNVPQELGGVRPRCAYLDIAKKMTSTEVRATIIAPTTEPENPVARSVRLDVLFSGRTLFSSGSERKRKRVRRRFTRSAER